MCTLTILRDEGRLLVTMNRDDVAARAEAAPSLWPNAGPTFAAPKDLQAGGTWIGVNAHGVVACLLNRYDTAPSGRISRGGIVLAAMRAASAEDALAALSALDHGVYSPFTCLVADLGGAVRVDWTGTRFDRGDLPPVAQSLLTSSSWQFDEVRAEREALFREIWSGGESTTDRLSTFHCQRDTERDFWAPMMQRPQSQTKSITQVELTPGAAEMRYWIRDTAISRKLTAPDTTIRIACAGAACRADLITI